MRIIGLAPNKWHGQWVNRQQLLSRLGLKHCVLYSTGAWSVWDRDSVEWRESKPLGTVDHVDNVAIEEAPKFLLRWPKWPRFDHLVIRAHARRLRRQLDRGKTSPLVTLVFHPRFFPYAKFLKSDLLIYHAYDLFERTPNWDADLDALEVALLREADLVTTVSETIAERLREKVVREIRVLPNGVDLEAFHVAGRGTTTIPQDLGRIPRPRLGYVGSLHFEIDYGLVAMLAQARPKWSFVFVGGIPKGVDRDERGEKELEQCRKCPNVHFLGEKHRNEVPAYLSNMDVNLMLYRMSNETWIRAVYPLKLHEYLAVGKPIVSADIPSVREFSSVVRIAAGFAEWQQAIEDALDSRGAGTESERRVVAAQNTWDARVAMLEEWISHLLDARKGKDGAFSDKGRGV
jgi:glycosyltransferase involved in cell wall biosynthesis